jgi:hypothetical protein
VTKDEAMQDLKIIAQNVAIMSENQQTGGWVISPFVFRNWVLRLNKIIAALDATD